MNLEAEIIIRLRMAFAEIEKVRFYPPNGVSLVLFYNKDGNICGKSLESFYHVCLQRGVQDVLLCDPEDGGFVCVWKDGTASLFKRDYQHTYGEDTIVYRESEYDVDTSSLLVADPTEEWKQNLIELEEMVKRMSEVVEIGDNISWFGDRLRMARDILDGKVVPNYDSAPDYVQTLSKPMQNLLFARQAAWIFGGMGRWYDSTEYYAGKLDAMDEYKRLSGDLWHYLHSSLQYVTNNCFKRKEHNE